jgi:SAM-dependent methyltransferase
MSVDLLVREGYDAWGLDLSSLRKWQWQQREQRNRLLVADALQMPFTTGYFDAVISSGVIEHIGVSEHRDPGYVVKALPERDVLRRKFLGELLRVCGSDGSVYVDCPNGLFPIDFWHGTEVGEARFHTWNEGFLPSFGMIRRLVRSIDPLMRVEALSPFGRLQFRQARTRWHGRLLTSPVRGFLRAMNFRPLRWLATSPLNPYLVVRIRRWRDV